MDKHFKYKTYPHHIITDCLVMISKLTPNMKGNLLHDETPSFTRPKATFRNVKDLYGILVGKKRMP